MLRLITKNEDDSPTETAVFLKSLKGGRSDKSIIPILRRKAPKKKLTIASEVGFDDVPTERNTAASSLAATRLQMDFTRSTIRGETIEAGLLSSKSIAKDSYFQGGIQAEPLPDKVVPPNPVSTTSSLRQ
jgi:hypothetical protein